MIDVYLYGMVSPSTVHVLREDFCFPQPNTYAEIARTLPSIGGEAANSAIVLARLGLSTKLDGNWLRADRAQQILGVYRQLGVDTSRLTVKETGCTEEVVIVDRTSRTVFGNYAAFHEGARQWNAPVREDVAEARIVCLDPYFKDESRQVAELCVRERKPYVTLDVEHGDFMARNAEAVVVSHELRDRAYAGRDMREVFSRYREECPGLVIFSFGSERMWCARGGREIAVPAPYAIEPVDTTGAGDAFRGALAYGLLQGWEDERTVEFASAVAACVCLTIPHALHAPDLASVLRFMKEHTSPRR